MKREELTIGKQLWGFCVLLFVGSAMLAMLALSAFVSISVLRLLFRLAW